MNDKEVIEQMARCMANCENTCDECFEQLESVTKRKSRIENNIVWRMRLQKEP